MKFGALLRTSAGEVPELQELFTAYKQLKKHLKVIAFLPVAGHAFPRAERLGASAWVPRCGACADLACADLGPLPCGQHRQHSIVALICGWTKELWAQSFYQECSGSAGAIPLDTQRQLSGPRREKGRLRSVQRIGAHPGPVSETLSASAPQTLRQLGPCYQVCLPGRFYYVLLHPPPTSAAQTDSHSKLISLLVQKLPEKRALAGGSASISPAAAKELGATEADFVATLSAGGPLTKSKIRGHCLVP